MMKLELLATDEDGEIGNLIPDAEAAAVDAPHARAGEEDRRQRWERLRREARAAGMNRRDAIAYATRAVDDPAPDPLPVADAPALDVPAGDGSGVAGLGDLPTGWPTLPANASLQAEVGWVQGNRVLVVQGGRVDLGRALSPAPSYAALAWLETAILYPSKFSDVCVRATQERQDDAEQVRRERLALLEVRDMLGEAMSTPLLAAM